MYFCADMQVHLQTRQESHFKKAVITIGSFDGVHAGHAILLEELKYHASLIGGESAVITFDPHPRTVLQHDASFKLLSTLEEKIVLFEQTGIDHLYVVNFDEKFAHQTPKQYLDDFLIKIFDPAAIVIGYDHRYGSDRSGDITLMEQHFKHTHTQIIEINPVLIQDIAISSSRIRKALEAGHLEEANKLSGHPYLISGKVIAGDRIGRQTGFPTANIQIAELEKAIPADGIYAAVVEIKGSDFEGMAYIGHRPVIGADLEKVVEVNLFDFDGDLYGKQLNLWLHHYIRPDKKLVSLEELTQQLELDKFETKKYFTQEKITS